MKARAPMRRLARQRLDQNMQPLRSLPISAKSLPSKGWIRAIREALGMRRQDLAARLGVTPAAIQRVEDSEAKGSIQLDTLKRAAGALGCELVYVLMPRKPLEEMVDSRRRELFLSQSRRAMGHMALEGQTVSQGELDPGSTEMAKAMFPDERLWIER